ncbi:DUF397 domain-containing protein [Streptomyces sp. NPDC090075]|uniref:DUF397 domain-containing protein n=1 Tax=Streptomyces sp. NPDC090075 TaxID=3365937 RepID=UPI0037FD10A3
MTNQSQNEIELAWFKSSYSGGNTTECLEAASIPAGMLIRDSKQAGRLHLTLSAKTWTSFVRGMVKSEGVPEPRGGRRPPSEQR